MEYRLGNTKYIKKRGFTQKIKCPHCEKDVVFPVFSNFERRLAVKLSLFDMNTIYFLVCPECASIFSVDEEKGEMFKSGNQSAITVSDLKTLKIFKDGNDLNNE